MKVIFLIGLLLLKTGDNSLQRIIIPIIYLCYSKQIAIIPINAYYEKNNISAMADMFARYINQKLDLYLSILD